MPWSASCCLRRGAAIWWSVLRAKLMYTPYDTQFYFMIYIMIFIVQLSPSSTDMSPL